MSWVTQFCVKEWRQNGYATQVSSPYPMELNMSRGNLILPVFLSVHFSLLSVRRSEQLGSYNDYSIGNSVKLLKGLEELTNVLHYLPVYSSILQWFSLVCCSSLACSFVWLKPIREHTLTITSPPRTKERIRLPSLRYPELSSRRTYGSHTRLLWRYRNSIL